MAAQSPRCIQQIPCNDTPPVKPLSTPLTPPSYTSDLSHFNLHPNPQPLSRPWIPTLLTTKFYGTCPTHSTLRKSDLNQFCTQHAVKICQYCRNSHSNCTILHVSRYMYHDVLLAKQAASLLDLPDVQSYLNNGNRVIYIDRRAQPKSKLAPHAKACVVCSRTLQDPYRFCSLFCRLAHANHPAAVETVPLPDACPLLTQPVRKIKTPTVSAKRERKKEHPPPPPPMSPVTPTTHHLDKTEPAVVPPPLQPTIAKRNRRKGTPEQSPILAARTLILLSQSGRAWL